MRTGSGKKRVNIELLRRDLELLDGHADEIGDVGSTPLESWSGDRTTRRAAERLLQLWVGCLVSVAREVLRPTGPPLFFESDDAVKGLREQAIVPDSLARKLRSVATVEHLVADRDETLTDQDVYERLQSVIKAHPKLLEALIPFAQDA